ncbi:hypothetical protein [Novacetimonas sp. GS1]|uniref:hypothetical protein n=1 Tax=Novacetimonas sp. GS1 TaxID=3119990 RepID=UPI002FCD5630
MSTPHANHEKTAVNQQTRTKNSHSQNITPKKKQKKEGEAHASPSLNACSHNTSLTINRMPVNRQVIVSR